MRILSKKTLVEYWTKVPAAEVELKAWFAEAKDAKWQTPVEIKAKYGSASILKEGRVVFNICGNNFRLVVRINYEFQTIYVRFVGTHKDYDKINAQSI